MYRWPPARTGACMNLDTLRTIVKRFLVEPRSEVLVLSGGWGVGKTYFWKKCVDDFKTDSARRTVSYVSLFGISSIRDLQIAVLANLQAINPSATEAATTTAGKQVERFKSFVKDARIWGAKNADKAPGGIGKLLSVALEAAAPYLVHDALICLDDFERLPRTGVQFDEVLGFITTLKEEKGCKVVLILNEDALAERADTFRTYREKVIDKDIRFSPTVDEEQLTILSH